MAIALITGGGSGIGAATGTLMAENGDTVILADINPVEDEEDAAGSTADDATGMLAPGSSDDRNGA